MSIIRNDFEKMNITKYKKLKTTRTLYVVITA